jgi:L-alanine-DL-glutamate epimerase-like enolase superfamily enzyme
MSRSTRVPDVTIESIDVSAFAVPTDAPEGDGTYQWSKTTLVLVETKGGGQVGIGYSYADTATAELVRGMLADVVRGRDAMSVPGAWAAMVHAIRNLGRPGIASMAISAVDSALWDLKGKLLGLALVDLLGAVRDKIDVYGSGGFTTYCEKQLRDQLGGWVAQGIPRVKMKIGMEPAVDPARVRIARDAIGPEAELFVDANGAYGRKQALRLAEVFAAEADVRWFEEPVTSDDLDGLRLLRDRAPAGIEVAAGEYGYDLPYFRRMLEAGAVDVLQADATRCAGITGFLRVAALCEARSLPLSAHCAPALHYHACCAVPPARHLEYFHDHARIESMLFDGAPAPEGGTLRPDRSRPGLGLEFRRSDAARFAV